MTGWARRARGSVAYRGWGRSLRVGWRRAAFQLRRGRGAPAPQAFDLEFSTDTASLAAPGETKGEPRGVPHGPVDPAQFARLAGLLPIDPAEYLFIDLGAGQGRALLLASDLPFRRIVGVEYGRALHASALANLARYHSPRQRCAALECVWENAAAWPIPAEPAVFYLSEPFDETTMRIVIGRIRDSLRAEPRPAYVMYLGNWFRRLWEESGEFEILATRGDDRIYIHRPREGLRNAMPSPSLYRRFRRSLPYRGWRRTVRVAWALARYRLRHGWRAPRPHAFDLEFGVQTAAMEFGTGILDASPPGNRHEPIDTGDFAGIVELLPAGPEGFTFIDFGSGLGRALLLASNYPFARIIGVEHSRDLHARSERNLARYRFAGQRCRRIEAVWDGAERFPLPAVPSVFYFCEPFREPMMRTIVDRLRASLAETPRPAYAIYVGECFREVWEESGEFVPVATQGYCRIYGYEPAGR